jgi:hypothetical protein
LREAERPASSGGVDWEAANIVEAIRGPQPPSPLALKLIDRFNRMAAENARFKALEQQAAQISTVPAAR